jgi:hypothetical protein
MWLGVAVAVAVARIQFLHLHLAHPSDSIPSASGFYVLLLLLFCSLLPLFELLNLTLSLSILVQKAGLAATYQIISNLIYLSSCLSLFNIRDASLPVRGGLFWVIVLSSYWTFVHSSKTVPSCLHLSKSTIIPLFFFLLFLGLQPG